MARRRKFLGLPIGKKKSALPRALMAAGAGIVGVPAAVVGARRMSGPISEGSQKVRQIAEIADTAASVKDAVSRHSTKIGKAGAVVGQLASIGSGDRGGDAPPKLSHLIEEHIEIGVPRSEAYNQWTQFEMFPSIVKGAERVEQQERDKVEWTSKIGPSRRTWPSEITEQVPDERIAWKSTGGLQMKGVVTFHSLDDELTRVLVQIEYDPRGPVEGVGNLLRIQHRRVRRDLRLFKHFVELRGEATGAWRSRIAKKGNTQEAEAGSGGRQDSRNGKRTRTGPGKRIATSARAASNARKASPQRHPRASGHARKAVASTSKSTGGHKRATSATKAKKS
jgi:hypothetical protein